MYRLRARAWGAGLAAGMTLAFLMPSSACILPDHCILVYVEGKNWCAPMEGALKWPEGHPELAEALLSNKYAVPRGCKCVNDTEHAILEDHLPVEAYLSLRAEIEALARQNCLTLGLDFANNCLVDLGPNASTISPEKENDDLHGPCVGSCEYIQPPPFGDCPYTDPFLCEEIVHGGAEDEADDGSACPIGAEDCPCTAGGACDSNLECVDGMCNPLPDDDADGGADIGPIFERQRIEQ